MICEFREPIEYFFILHICNIIKTSTSIYNLQKIKMLSKY